MAEQLTARDVEWLMSPDETLHVFWSAQVARTAHGLIRAWCTQLVPVQLLKPTLPTVPGRLCSNCVLVYRTQLPGLEPPKVGE